MSLFAMGLLRSRSHLGSQDKKSSSALRKDSAVAERGVNGNAFVVETQRQKSVSEQERPKTAHSQPEWPKTADRHLQERPKTADRQQTVDRRRSFSRPRTANSAKDREKEKEQMEMALPTQTIEFKAGKDTYNFPTPSPRLPPPRSATLHTSPARSPLSGVVGESPKIGVAIGSPREMPPHWGRTHTADAFSKKLPARPPPTRAMTELPQVPSTLR